MTPHVVCCMLTRVSSDANFNDNIIFDLSIPNTEIHSFVGEAEGSRVNPTFRRTLAIAPTGRTLVEMFYCSTYLSMSPYMKLQAGHFNIV